jgi:hypothetical protein
VIPPPTVTLPDPPAIPPVPPIVPAAGMTPAVPPMIPLPKDPDPIIPLPKFRPPEPAPGSAPIVPSIPDTPKPSVPFAPPEPSPSSDPVVPPAPPLPAAPKFTPLAAVPEGVTPAYVNLSRVRIKYEVTKAGPSGVGTVELWLKDKNGWSKAADVKSGEPLEAELPADGAYGLKVVPVSGQGVRGAGPVKDTAPDLWVMRDTVKPAVTVTVTPAAKKLAPLPPDAAPFVVEVFIDEANLDCQSLVFTWRDAAAKKGEPEVASPLFTGADLAKGKLETKIGTFTLRKDKDKPNANAKMVFDWTPAADVPARVTIGVEAADRAGNKDAARAEIGTDLTEPAAKVTGVQVVPRSR